MNSKAIYILTILSCLFIFSNCGGGDDDDDGQPMDGSSTELSCCEVPHLQGCAGGAKFYVPNAFTPNGDGINDVFMLHTALDGKGIKGIPSFRISTVDGEPIFSRLNAPSPFPIFDGWDGKQGTGEIIDGVYKYNIEVTNIADETFSFEGHVCVRSLSPAPCETYERHCVYSNYHNGNGVYDPFIPSQELPCQ